MSCWMKFVVVGVMGAGGLALGQTRIGPATVRIDAAGIGESDRRGQCESGQRGGETFQRTPGNRSACGRWQKRPNLICRMFKVVPNLPPRLSNVQS